MNRILFNIILTCGFIFCVNVSNAQLEDCAKKFEQAQSENLALKKKTKELRAKNQKLTTSESSLNRKLDQLRGELEGKQAIIGSLESSKSSLNIRLDQLRGELEGKQAIIGSLEQGRGSDYRSLLYTLGKKETALSITKSSLEDAEEQLKQSEDNLEALRKVYEQDSIKSQKELNEKNGELEKVNEAKMELDVKVKELSKQVDKNNGQIEQLTDENEKNETALNIMIQQYIRLQLISIDNNYIKNVNLEGKVRYRAKKLMHLSLDAKYAALDDGALTDSIKMEISLYNQETPTQRFHKEIVLLKDAGVESCKKVRFYKGFFKLFDRSSNHNWKFKSDSIYKFQIRMKGTEDKIVDGMIKTQ